VLRVNDTTFWNNRARVAGGGFLHLSDAGAEIENTTLSGNSAGENGGGLFIDADSGIHVVNATIVDNSAPVGAGVGAPIEGPNFPVTPSPLATFRNTIVWGNRPGPDCNLAVTSEGGNLDGGSSCHFQGPGDHSNIDPLVEELANNPGPTALTAGSPGGPTLTHALSAASPAIDRGVSPCPATDQRGVRRPQNSGCDTGAYELEAAPDPTPRCVATTMTVGADADSWVLQSSAASNYGSDSVVKVDSKAGGNARALVRFALPAIPPVCQVVNATLRLYAGSYKEGRILEALQVAGGWNESSVTWNNQPGTTGAAASTASASGYIEWSVTSQVRNMYSGANNGFLVGDTMEDGTGTEQGFHSREKGTDQPPQLVITVE
jgi:hypothetical protein